MFHNSSDDSVHNLRSNDEINNTDDDHEPINQNEHEEDKNVNDTARRIDPTTSRKYIVRKPIPKLNTARLRGQKGVQTIEKYFEGFKYNGKGYEKKDLDRIMKRLEHWSHRLFPKYRFDDFLEKIEVLGVKRDLQTFLMKYRRDMLLDDVIINDGDDDNLLQYAPSSELLHEFDLLIAEQIEKTKQVTMPQQNPINADISNVNMETPNQELVIDNLKCNAAKIESSNDEMQKRIKKNRQLAIERKLMKLKKNREMKNREVQESSVIYKVAPQTSHERQIEKKNSTTIANEEIISSNISSLIDEPDLILKNYDMTESLLTKEKLNKTIDDAVNQFMEKKRKLT